MPVEKPGLPTHLTLSKLPSLPQVLVRILDAVNQESADFQALSDIIRQDAAMTARLLSVANSSFYRRQNNCDTVDRALMCLGLETVRTLVMTAAVKQYFSYFDQQHRDFMRHFWRRSLISAYSAQTFANLTGYPSLPQAYLCGLLSDVGQLCLLADQGLDYQVLCDGAGSDQALLEAEKRLLDATHEQLGSALLDSWQMDNFMADAVLYHHQSAEHVASAHHLVKIINMASAFSESAKLSDATIARADRLFGLNEGLLRELRSRIDRDVEAIAGSLGIGAGVSDGLPNGKAFADNQANQKLGEKLSELSQIQNFRASFAGAPHIATSQKTRRESGEAVGRTLYLGLGMERHVVFLWQDSLQALEADGHLDSQFTGFLMRDAEHSGSLIARAFSQQIALSNESQPTPEIIDQQLLRYCRTPYLLCLPFAVEGGRGVVVAGADKSLLEQQRQKPQLWQALVNEVAHLLLSVTPSASQPQDTAMNSRIREAVHEVSNPLSVINNYLEILRLKLGNGEQTEREFSILKEEIDRIGKILLRLSAPEQNVEEEQVDVNLVTGDLAAIFRESMCLTRNIKLDFQADKSIPSLVLNKAALKQVLSNLIKNAVEAMPQGGNLNISTRNRVIVNGKPHISISIEDTGSGIPDAVMSQLFYPLQSTKDGNHAGLGLSVVKKLMDEMKAQVLCSTDSSGTQFKLLFPMSLAKKEAPSPDKGAGEKLR